MTTAAVALWGFEEIGVLFGVGWKTVAGWERRYQDSHPVPVPDYTSPRGQVMVWLSTRESEWRDWYASRPETVTLMGAAEIAQLFGVKPTTVSQWVNRYEGTSTPTPKPDFTLGGDRAWLPERAQEWRDWDASRSGQGVGGGRPWPDRAVGEVAAP